MANVLVWSVLSLIVLLGGIGLLFGAFGRRNILGWHGRSRPPWTSAPRRGRANARASACRRGSLRDAALFVIEVFVGAVLEHVLRRAVGLLRHGPRETSRSTHAHLGTRLVIFWAAKLLSPIATSSAPMMPGASRRGRATPRSRCLGRAAVAASDADRSYWRPRVLGDAATNWSLSRARGPRPRARVREVAAHDSASSAPVFMLWACPARSCLRNEQMATCAAAVLHAPASIPAFCTPSGCSPGLVSTSPSPSSGAVGRPPRPGLPRAVHSTVMVADIFVLLGLAAWSEWRSLSSSQRSSSTPGRRYRQRRTNSTLRRAGRSTWRWPRLLQRGAEAIRRTFLTRWRCGCFPPAPAPHRQLESRRCSLYRWAVMFLVAVGPASSRSPSLRLPDQSSICSRITRCSALCPPNHGHAATTGVYGIRPRSAWLCFCLRHPIPESVGPRSGRGSCSGRRTSASCWMCFATVVPPRIAEPEKSRQRRRPGQP